MEVPTQIEGIDRETITPIVRRVLGCDTVEVLDWRCDILHGSLDSALFGGGVYRLSGTGQDHGRSVPWSVVLKLTPPSRAGLLEPGEQTNFHRERLCYQSGLLDDLPGGISAPRFFGSFERPDGTIGLWLENVVETVASVWPLSQYGIAARHLGQFSGAYLVGRPLPDCPWLARDWLRGYVAMGEAGFDLYPSLRDHPWVRRGLPGDLAERALRLWTEREIFFAALDRLPQTFCHGDAFRGNLLAHGDETVAMDWTDAGIGALGEELAPMVSGFVIVGHGEAVQAQELDGIAFESYVVGLREAGWEGDPRLVRFGYLAAAGLRYGLGIPGAGGLLLMTRWDGSQRAQFEGAMGPVEGFLDRRAGWARLALGLADEARELLAVAEAARPS